jgi:sugar-specific transcriptional regulator TrmB
MTTVNKGLVSTLKLVGLSENEARIYLVCLEIGPSSAWDIYLKSGFKRPTCYAILQSLISKGIASKTPDKKRTIFSIIDPSELLTSMDNRRNQLKESLPLFSAIASQSSGKPKIRLYEGLEGARQAYMLGLGQPEGSEILIFGFPKVWMDNYEINRAYIEKRMQKKISLRVIFPDKQDNRSAMINNNEELREIRFLPKNLFDPSVETEIFGNTVSYIAYSGKEPFATVIENDLIASDEKQRFEALWKIAKK